MRETEIVRLCDCPARLDEAAAWFHAKWSVPLAAYRESMAAGINDVSAVPQWYLVPGEAGEIIAGAGIIENDFHDRKDLYPNLCALYVEPRDRGQGIARALLDFARKEAGRMGYDKLYLITDHVGFYEKCGWEFSTFVTGDDGAPGRLYVAPAIY